MYLQANLKIVILIMLLMMLYFIIPSFLTKCGDKTILCFFKKNKEKLMIFLLNLYVKQHMYFQFIQNIGRFINKIILF
jgi:hypothetical protein